MSTQPILLGSQVEGSQQVLDLVTIAYLFALLPQPFLYELPRTPVSTTTVCGIVNIILHHGPLPSAWHTGSPT